MKLDDIRGVNKRREEGGWVKVPDGDLAGVRLRVRHGDSEVASKLAADIWAAATPEERKKPEFSENLNKRVMHEAILLGWDLDDEFTPESAKEALEMAAFREAVALAARRVGQDGTETLEADAKN